MLNKTSTPYGAAEQEKFFISSSHGPSSGSSSLGSTSSTGGIGRSHTGLLAPIPVPGVSHQSGIPIQQQNHAKSGSIITGNPLRPPPSTGSYHPDIPASHVSPCTCTIFKIYCLI